VSEVSPGHLKKFQQLLKKFFYWPASNQLYGPPYIYDEQYFKRFFQQMAENTITFKLVPNMNKPLIRESRVRLRALFDYDPMEDKYIPCKEAGLSFTRGDILHIVSQDDPYW
jgi:hypothetical protein